MSMTYRLHFLLRQNKQFNESCFMKNAFDFKPFCNSRFNSATANMLVRLQNTFASAMNKNPLLPKYVLVVLDDDLITYMNYKGTGVAVLLGEWVTWLVKTFQELIKKRKEQLPNKSKKENMPCMYWCAAPTHVNFSLERNTLRKKYNQCVETVMKLDASKNMRLIRFKDRWNSMDSSLVVRDKMTDHGLNIYWAAIDASFKFNVTKHELFLAKRLVSNQPNDLVNNEVHQEDAKPVFRLTASFTSTSKVSWMVEAFSLCMFLLLPTLREVPHGMKGTGPKFVMRPVYSRSQLRNNANTVSVLVLLMHLFHTLYTRYAGIAHHRALQTSGRGWADSKAVHGMECSGGVHALLEIPLSRAAA